MEKRCLSLLLAGVLGVSLLAGCGNAESGSGNAADDKQTTGTEAAADDSADDADDEDMEVTDINLYALALGETDGVAEVQDAVNEISEKEIGVHVNLNLMDAGSFMQQIGLMLAGGESVDLLQVTPLGSVAFNACQSQNQLMEISDLLNEYAPDLVDTVGDYLKGMEVEGGLYGVPGYRLLNSNMYIYMRADVLDELDLRAEAEAADSWSDIDAIFEKVYAAQDSLPEDMKTTCMISNTGSTGDVITVEPALAGNDDWSKAKGYDTLGDSYYIVGVDDSSDTVFSWYESEDFQNEIKIVKDWYDKGYVYKDAATSEETGDNNIKNGIAFANVAFSEPGVESSKQAATGYDLVCRQISSGPVTTGSARSWGWAVPVTSSEPEAAAKFMNLMYTNADIENLLTWGIEGRDYELNEAGEAVRLDGATYTSGDFLWGNQFLAYPAQGQGSDFRATSLADMESAGISKYYGCSVNVDSISNELTSINNVISTYYARLASGSTTDLDADYQEFIDGLKSAGVDKVVETYQTALDAWLAEQN